MKRPADLDPRAEEAWKTCRSCPEEYMGRLYDGTWFYFRYRWGHAYVGLGATLDDAIEDDTAARDYGGVLDGEWPDVAGRNAAFAELLTDALNRNRDA